MLMKLKKFRERKARNIKVELCSSFLYWHISEQADQPIGIPLDKRCVLITFY